MSIVNYSVVSEVQLIRANMTINQSLLNHCKAYINANLGRKAGEAILLDDWIAYTNQATIVELSLIAPLYSTFVVNVWDMPSLKLLVGQLKSEHPFVELTSHYQSIFDQTGVESFYLVRSKSNSQP